MGWRSTSLLKTSAALFDVAATSHQMCRRRLLERLSRGIVRSDVSKPDPIAARDRSRASFSAEPRLSARSLGVWTKPLDHERGAARPIIEHKFAKFWTESKAAPCAHRYPQPTSRAFSTLWPGRAWIEERKGR
ncbi:MAG: hypothetical protein IIC49_00155 [Planctomycetes bacterium]|nr:hypothetical protein [Planctomycetota bacterium]